MKPLVVYYSLTGKTKLVAQVIAEALNAKLVEIKETKSRKPGPSIYAIGGLEATMNKRSKINIVSCCFKSTSMGFILLPLFVMAPKPPMG